MEKEYGFRTKESTKNEPKHSLQGNRSFAKVTGVLGLLSCVGKEILLDTTAGMLMIRGKDLKLSCFDNKTGEVEILGKIESYTYS